MNIANNKGSSDGNSGVGKSCMLMRYSDNNFTNNFYNTIGVDFKIKTAQIDGKMLKMQIWDTAGQDRFRTITNSYYKGAHGIIVVYDITDRESFENIKIWMQEIDKYAQTGVVRLLVGNKTDLTEKRKVGTDEGQALAEHYEINFIETSAKSSSNIENAFHDIARTVIQTKYSQGNKKDNLKLKESAPLNQTSCC